MRSCYFLQQNYIDPAVVNGVTVSSEAAGYPYATMAASNTRFKKWRSAGYWSVTSGNNTLVFQETIGVNLTATIAIAAYASSTAFCAAVKAALDAAGTKSYTVAVDSTTKKITLTSPSGTFRLICTHSSSAGFCNLVGFSTASDKIGLLTYSSDILKIHSSEFIVWDLGIASNPKALILGTQGSKRLNLSSSAVITIQGNGTNDFTSPAYSISIPYNDRQIALLNSAGIFGAPQRYVRIIISDPSNIDGYIEFSKMYLGDIYSPTRGGVQFPFESEFSDRSAVVYSDNGQAFGLKKNITQKFQTEWNFLTFAEKEYIEGIYFKFGKVVPFYIAYDANAAFSSSSNYYLRFCRFSQEPNFQLTDPGIFAMRLQFEESL